LSLWKVTVVFLCVLMCGLAQGFRSFRGEIHADGLTDLSWLVVHLDQPGQSRSDSASVTSGGDFSFLNVAEGLYTLRVVDPAGNEILSKPITIGVTSAPVMLELPKSVDARPAGETTSVVRLRHRPGREAMAAAAKGQKFSENGDREHAAIEWRKAVDADPDFSEAHGNLGAQYFRLHRTQEAVEEFRRAVALDPHTAIYQTNLAVGLAQLGHLDEAESWARSAVRVEDSNPMGHYVLGCILTSRPSKTAEAVQQLQIAARQIPRAHEVLAKIYEAEGKKSLAVAERRQLEEVEAAIAPHD